MMKTWTGLIEALYGISRRLEWFYRRFKCLLLEIWTGSA
jgi:hypothetical protein